MQQFEDGESNFKGLVIYQKGNQVKSIIQAMVNDISLSRKLIREASIRSFIGAKFDVICARGTLAYKIYAERYCEVKKRDMTCVVFSQ